MQKWHALVAALALALAACTPTGGGHSPTDPDMSELADGADLPDGADMATAADARTDDDAGAARDGGAGDAGLDDADRPDADHPDAAPPIGTAGCGRPAVDALGGVQIEARFDDAAGGSRSYFLALPADYDPNRAHRLIVGYAGTNWSGEMIRPYLDLERDARADEIVVYPDLLFREFEGWGRLGGWLLGPHARPADGLDDIEFTRQLLDRLGEQYCLDPERIFATGHSWGGDMAAVVGCFLGDRFRAVAPAAANRPYWFEPVAGPVGCVGTAAVWTFFGQADEHFNWQDFPGQFGDEQVAWWRAQNGCGDASAPLPFGADGECVAYADCTHDTRYCLYGPATGHQIPPYFSGAILDWFRSF